MKLDAGVSDAARESCGGKAAGSWKLPGGEGEQPSVGRAWQKCKVCVQPQPCPGSPPSPKAALVMMSF